MIKRERARRENGHSCRGKSVEREGRKERERRKRVVKVRRGESERKRRVRE